MDNLSYARSLMALSLGFHIIFAAIGVGIPLLMVSSEALWLKTKNKVYLDLSKKWAQGTALLFVIGAVSGTVLSFELGLLWPGFMEFSGEIIGIPFAMEGFAFFMEAIFLGIYLYAWDKISPSLHLISGIIVSLSGLMSAVFVVATNAWMNSPTGFTLLDGKAVDIQPFVAMFNPSFLQQAIHLVLASYLATLFAVAGVHAFFLLKNKQSIFHKKALEISLVLLCCLTPLQLISGDFSAKVIAKIQPTKFAAMEAHYKTEEAASFIIGGIPNDETEEVKYAIKIPAALSFLAHGDFKSKVIGLEETPKDQWPNIKIVHWSFDIMISCGMLMLLLALWAVYLHYSKSSIINNKQFLWSLVLASPIGFIAIETGWIVTEVGRQPWIIQGIMRTTDAVTPIQGLATVFYTFSGLYLFLMLVLIFLLIRIFKETETA